MLPFTDTPLQPLQKQRESRRHQASNTVHGQARSRGYSPLKPTRHASTPERESASRQAGEQAFTPATLGFYLSLT